MRIYSSETLPSILRGLYATPIIAIKKRIFSPKIQKKLTKKIITK